MNNLLRRCLLLSSMALLAACSAPTLKAPSLGMPAFLKREPAPETEVAPIPAAPKVDPSLTPRELLVAKLVNSRSEGDAVPGMTVGKLVEFADRYLACDCADTRFAKAWQRTAEGYVLVTNASQVQPLDFRCSGSGEAMQCYLREIDRGANLTDLKQRFMPGGDFVRFIYEQGSKCERVEPCPGSVAPAEPPAPVAEEIQPALQDGGKDP